MSAYDSPNHPFVHEYGHYISNSLTHINGSHWEEYFIHKVAEKYSGKKVNNINSWIRKNPISAYGASSISETFAEIFAEAYGNPNASKLATIFRDELENQMKKVVKRNS